MERLDLFPDSTRLTENGMTIGGCDVAALAEQFGTPLYLYDRVTLDASLALYRQALSGHYPGQSGITYAGKAYLCLAVAQWARQQGLWVDCTGQGEIGIAVAAGVHREHLLVHGVNKSVQDLDAAAQHAGTVVVDHLEELGFWLNQSAGEYPPDLWLRFQPEVSVDTHAHIQTGQSGSKFGLDSAAIFQAAAFCRQQNLPLKGLHFHLGSQMRDPAPVALAIQRTLDLAARLRLGSEWTLSPGGGWGMAYNEQELPHPDVKAYVRVIAEAVVSGCRLRDLSLPRLQLEPGRSLVARAGVAVYRVGAVKRSGGCTWVLMDGGLADNPRHALYGVNYSALVVQRPLAPAEAEVSLAGPYCESGDVLSTGLTLPRVEPGDLLAVPVSGAYQLSLSSNYNGAGRPAVVWLDRDSVRLIQERETVADLLRRDHPLEP